MWLWWILLAVSCWSHFPASDLLASHFGLVWSFWMCCRSEWWKMIQWILFHAKSCRCVSSTHLQPNPSPLHQPYSVLKAFSEHVCQNCGPLLPSPKPVNPNCTITQPRRSKSSSNSLHEWGDPTDPTHRLTSRALLTRDHLISMASDAYPRNLGTPTAWKYGSDQNRKSKVWNVHPYYHSHGPVIDIPWFCLF